MTTLSPRLVGMVETRRPIGFFCCAVIFDQRFPNFFEACANQLELALEQKAQAIDRVDVEWIAYGYDQTGFAKSDWNDFEPPRVFSADLFDNRRRNHHRGEIDPVHVRLRRERT